MLSGRATRVMTPAHDVRTSAAQFSTGDPGHGESVAPRPLDPAALSPAPASPAALSPARLSPARLSLMVAEIITAGERWRPPSASLPAAGSAGSRSPATTRSGC